MSGDGSVQHGRGVIVNLDPKRGTAQAQVGPRRIFISRHCLVEAGISVAVGDTVEVVFDCLRLNRAESIRLVAETTRPVAARGRAMARKRLRSSMRPEEALR